MAFMLPFLGKAGAAMLPGLLQHLFGGKDPRQQYMQQVQNLLSPQNMSKLTQGFYQQNLGSPAYAQGQRQIAAGANETGNQVAAKMGASGIGQSGTGALLSSLTPSLTGNAMAGLQTGAFNQAQGAAQNSIQQQLQALGQTGQPWTQGPSQTSQMFGGGMAALGPLLQALMGHMAKGGMAGYPGYGGGGVQNQGQPQGGWG